MRNLLLQLDTSPLPSSFDQVVGFDAGADQIMSYGGVKPEDVRDLIHGCIFTRAPKDLRHTAVWIGGANMAAGEAVLEAARQAMFPPFTVSLMLDSNGSNTTAVAAVVKIEQTLGSLAGKKALVTAGTGPVGLRAAGLLARDGAEVHITSRRPEDGERAAHQISERFGGKVKCTVMREPEQAAALVPGHEILLNCGPAGVMLVPKAAWAGVKGLEIAVDLNAVPPLGVEGIEVHDAAVTREGIPVFGALGVGNFKTKLHKRSVARLFEKSDLVLDAETIAEIARELVKEK
ncbi:MAG TPA: NAD(P)-dependent methylenetetrahydromethanopterin dehydrogenase [Gemmatimonadales bacterium]|nr:NAD(P)-dependent methylenetetrahydromethanopterin dehydrogenase [Gemmatimonadales bacterium]